MKRGDLILHRTVNMYGEYVPQYGIILNEEYPEYPPRRYFNALMQCGEIKLISNYYSEVLTTAIT